jgi:exoribonuclease R
MLSNFAFEFNLRLYTMDAEACRRGTSTYLVQRRLDMLPKPLTEVRRCSFTLSNPR